MSDSPIARWLKITPQYLLPQHLLSRGVGWLANTRIGFIKRPLIRMFAKQYKVNMSEAQQPNLDSYANFNEFFTRPLNEDARPLAGSGLLSPADGAISQLGTINDDRVFQAKGHDFSLTELLGGNFERAQPFRDGSFATIYLSPRDYHRVHMPLSGKLTEMIYVPGKLFSVNSVTARNVPSLFARNERLVCIFATNHGPMAVVLVGAMIVAAIETPWAGQVAPRNMRYVTSQSYQGDEVSLARGEEMGRFKLGSTAIVIMPKDTVAWSGNFKEGTPIQMGEQLATFI